MGPHRFEICLSYNEDVYQMVDKEGGYVVIRGRVIKLEDNQRTRLFLEVFNEGILRRMEVVYFNEDGMMIGSIKSLERIVNEANVDDGACFRDSLNAIRELFDRHEKEPLFYALAMKESGGKKFVTIRQARKIPEL